MKKLIKILPLTLILLLGFTETANMLTGNWYQQFMPDLNNMPLSDVFFLDSLTGWAVTNNNMPNDSGYIFKTTNGGSNWATEILPYGGNIITTGIDKFSALNKDTLWGVGGTVFYGAGQFRGMIYRTIDGGQNWLFQVPDTTIHIPAYKYIQFVNLKNGWAYSSGLGGIHTTNGGDTTFLTGIKEISSNVPKEFKLYQNFPNPFNPVTNIKYQIVNSKNVTLKVYDIMGRELITLVDQKQNAGTYNVNFDGNSYLRVYIFIN